MQEPGRRQSIDSVSLECRIAGSLVERVGGEFPAELPKLGFRPSIAARNPQRVVGRRC